MFCPETGFGGFSDADGTVRFYVRVNACLEPHFVVLDVGCGRRYGDDPVSFRRNLRVLQGKCRRVIGIDVDPAACENPFLDEFRLIDGDGWPLEDESIDLCVCDYVLEHVSDPDAFFSECGRVMKSGGVLCIRTPNAWGYESLAARLVPNRWHPSLMKKVKGLPQQTDVFPTLFRCNTVRKIRSLMRRHGFEACVYTYSAEPSYLSFSKIAFFLGLMWHRIAPRMLRSNVFGFGRKVSQGRTDRQRVNEPRRCIVD